MKAKTFGVTSILLCLTGTLWPLLAEEAFTVPRSNRVIEGKLTFPDGFKTDFVTRDGTWVTVENRKDHYFYGFVGIVNDKTSNPNFLIYSLLRTSPKDTAAVQITMPVDVPCGTARKYPIAKGIQLFSKHVEEWDFASAPVADPSQFTPYELMELYGVDSGDSMCCVVCDDRVVCASAVSNKCGSCGGGGGGGFMEN